MPIPSRSEQARKVADWLEAGAEEGENLDRFALRIVDAFHEMIKSGLGGPTERLETGTAFKSPVSSKPYWVSWQNYETYWLTQADSKYGWLINKSDPFFEVVTPSSAKAGKPGTNKDGWKVDEIVTAFQGQLRYIILAVHDNGVLLALSSGGMYQPESNENMSKYYERGTR